MACESFLTSSSQQLPGSKWMRSPFSHPTIPPALVRRRRRRRLRSAGLWRRQSHRKSHPFPPAALLIGSFPPREAGIRGSASLRTCERRALWRGGARQLSPTVPACERLSWLLWGLVNFLNWIPRRIYALETHPRESSRGPPFVDFPIAEIFRAAGQKNT